MLLCSGSGCFPLEGGCGAGESPLKPFELPCRYPGRAARVSGGDGRFSQRLTIYPITCDGKSWSAMDGKGLSQAPAVSVHLWPGGRDSSALPRVHESSIQLIFPPFPSLLLSPGGGRTDIVWSTSSGSCYAWQEVQPLRPAALREAEGPRFWQGDREEWGGKEGMMQRAALTQGRGCLARTRLCAPRPEEAPELRRRFGSILGDGGCKGISRWG